MEERFIQIAYSSAMGGGDEYFGSSEHLIGLTNNGRIFTLDLPNDPDHNRHQWKEIKLPNFNQ